MIVDASLHLGRGRASSVAQCVEPTVLAKMLDVQLVGGGGRRYVRYM